jgi:hypothetical protein
MSEKVSDNECLAYIQTPWPFCSLLWLMSEMPENISIKPKGKNKLTKQ